MSEKSYHHGNLRTSLIEAGIEIVNEEGINGCSLRKVAAKCGVSHAAPYSHFKAKEELLEAMKQYVTEKFTLQLTDAIARCENEKELTTQLGKAYVFFFVENPNYFPFVFSQSSFQIDLTSRYGEVESYEPFDIFKNTVVSVMDRMSIPKTVHLQTLLAMWSVVHGIAAIATMKSVVYDGNWMEMLEKILSENIVLPIDNI